MQNAKFHDSEKEKLIPGADVVIKLEKNSEGLPLEVHILNFVSMRLARFESD